MKGFIARMLLGKEAGAFMQGNLKNAFKGISGKATLGTAHAGMQAMRMQLYMAVPLTILSPGTPEEKMQNLAWNLGAAFMTMGMSSPWRQFGWGTALAMMPHYGSMTRGIVQGYRGTLEARTSLAIPFSHSTLAMDQAFASLQYSRTRVSDAYTTIGSEAAFFAARYTSRG